MRFMAVYGCALWLFSFPVKALLPKEVVYSKHELTEGRYYNLTIFKCLALGFLTLTA